MDDLLDLNWSSSSKTTSSPAPPQPTKSLNAFDLLSKPTASSSSPSYSITPVLRPSTPNTAPIQPTSRLPQPGRISVSRSTTPNIVSPPSDAFSELLSIKSSAGTTKTQSLADRQKQLAEERKQKEDHERQIFQANGSFWDSLGGQPNNAESSDGFPAIQPVPSTSLLPSSLPPSIRAPQPATVQKQSFGAFWDEDDSIPARKDPSPQPQKMTSTNLAPNIDILQLEHTGPASGTSSGMRTPLSDFDFGDGDLHPLEEYRSVTKTHRPNSSQHSPKRQSSPPPHIVGQIVEMGFSPSQAREALGKTLTGLDVQAALELLLGGQAEQPEAEDEDRVLAEQSRRETEERERRRRRRAGPSRDSVRPRTKEQQTDDMTTDQLAEQAEKIYAQASAFGQSALSKATSLWNSSKDKAMKAYEEQRKAMEAGARQPRLDGRPRWMVDAEDNQDFAEGSSVHQREEVWNGDSRPKARSSGATRATSKKAEDADQYRSVKERADLLFATEPETYKSPVRHRSKVAPAQRPITPVAPLPVRTLVEASAPQVAAYTAAKAKGNEHFKLGRFAEAEAAYTTAVSALPEGHLLLIPLFNNRAATRIKLGQSTSAIEDCSSAIELVGPTYHPNKEAPLPPSLAAEVKLSDALVKATIRRAQAYEMSEKYQLALQDWDRVMTFDAVVLGSSLSATRKLAAEGARRVRGQLDQASKPQPLDRQIHPAQPARPSRPVDVENSAAVSELRKVAEAANREEEARIAVKDSVDGKLNAWKGGKEANLRALIASLDTVLWDEILSGGLKVGMHELITEKQVKIKYMKVIARLHPDKINVNTTTVEQRMLANGAFSTLNEAWQAFSNA
ncbi:hypothetical protein BCR39DRAFT_348685 [Naematelia encephala]|uniref:UBA domain-containing protein n=1 Tax=Naematelia encephala TaxID=71784 RepID=A0A1Y2ALY1_9TREE|nr:hypothetical protein BCR39DRAFT_348685 [Naematelia encephala]